LNHLKKEMKRIWVGLILGQEEILEALVIHPVVIGPGVVTRGVQGQEKQRMRMTGMKGTAAMQGLEGLLLP